VPTATTDAGAKFFGLAHPTVQYLIQSCAGARKCVNYRCARFELSRGESDAYDDDDASVSASLYDHQLSADAMPVSTAPIETTTSTTSAACRPTLSFALTFS